MSTVLTRRRAVIGVAHDPRDRRREDPRLLTGRGRFVADLRLPGMVHLAFLRSPHAHARIRSLDLERARALPGVVLVASGEDLGPELQRTLVLPALATGEVHYLGQAVALVVAADRYQAEDARERIEVDYEPLPVVSDAELAVLPGSPPADTTRPSNIGPVLRGRRGDLETAFATADRVLRERFRFGRASAHPLETRGAVAAPDLASQGVIFRASVQQPHATRSALAAGLGLPLERVRVAIGDVGGGFGVKSQVYPEDLCVAWAALRLDRPVKWIEDRSEHFAAVAHEREQVHELEAAIAEDGTILGLRARILHDQGSHVARGLMVPSNCVAYLPGPYFVPAYDAEAVVAYTNKMTTGPYRGTGLPMVNYAMERLMDRIAAELGLDPLEVRRRNLLQPEQLPFDTGIALDEGKPIVLDSGDYPGVLAAAADFLSPEGFEQRRARAAEHGLLRGRAVAFGHKGTGRGAERAEVKLDATGRVVCCVGTGPSGQGHETSLARVCARNLGVCEDAVAVLPGDTARVQGWLGTVSCRTAPVAAPAVAEAARRLRRKLIERAALFFGCATQDVRLDDGWLSGAGQRLSLADLARRVADGFRSGERDQPYEPEAELVASAGFTTPGRTFTFSVHVAEVDVDPETGRVFPREIRVAYDCGSVINPLIVEGQVHGGVSYGVSMALFEELIYNERAQLLNASYADYLLPSSDGVPALRTARVEVPSALNPEGYRGAGEVGDMGPAPAIAAAVENALSGEGSPHLRRLPLTPERVWTALRGEADRD